MKIALKPVADSPAGSYNARHVARRSNMAADDELVIYTDGAARGNPGPAAFAFVIKRDGHTLTHSHGCLGQQTNNQAEYTALVRALEEVVRRGDAKRLTIRSDSELMVKQMRGEYRVKDAGLLALYQEAKKLQRQFEHVAFQHIPRSQNSEADRLCNEALDGEKDEQPTRRSKPARLQRDAPRTAGVRERAVECLQSAAEAWSHGNARHPDPALVWDQLWSILEDEGIVRRGKVS
jgi:ribonuclease HI